MTTVLLVSHGRTTADTDRVLAGWTPGVHLDEEGRAQAKRLSERLGGLALAGVVTSPLERCRETTETMVAGLTPLPDIATDLDLADCRYGQWTGRPLAELSTDPLWAALEARPSSVAFPGGEALSAMQARAVGAVRRWNLRFGPGAVYAAVTHAAVIRAILADAAGMHFDMNQRLRVDPASVSVVRFRGAQPLIEHVNDTDGGLGDLLP